MVRSNDLDLANYLPYLVNRVGAALVTEFTAQGLASENLTIAMWRVLAALSFAGAQRQVDVSALTSIEVSTLSRIVAQLARRGLVTRERSATSNREVTVALSSRGQAVVKKLIPVARALERKALGSIPAKDVLALRRVLRTVFENMKRN
jgi:DNA-binding MarR family transcriptional regulator